MAGDCDREMFLLIEAKAFEAVQVRAARRSYP